MGIHLREDLKAGSKALETHRLVVLSAPGGYGKTTLARAWCERWEAGGRSFAWLSVRRLHADPALFAEDLLGEVRAALPDRAADGFGEEVLRAAQQGVEPESLARLLGRALDRLEQPLILCLDGFEHLDGESRTADMVDALLRVDRAPVHWLITTRGSLPRAAAGRIATSEAKEIGAAELSLRSDQIQSILEEEGVSLSTRELTRLLARTQGWAIAIRFAARAARWRACVLPIRRRPSAISFASATCFAT